MSDSSPSSGATYAQWAWFLSLGLVLIVCGIAAILLALFSPIPPSLVLARVLMLGGLFQIIHALRVKTWNGFAWDLLLGVVQLFGGILLELNVLAGVGGIAGGLALVFLLEGLMQVALAVRVYPQDGWVWLVGSGLVALVASGGFLFKVRLVALHTPEIMAGIALFAAGTAYVAIGIASRRVDRDR